MRLTTRTRWLVPAVLVGVVAAGVGGAAAFTADASPPLPAKSAGQLLVDLQNADVTGLSGTVVQNSALGIPALPTVGGHGSADLTGLLAGPHTMRVWYAGPEKVRLALLGTLGESDIIRNGRNAWVWESAKNSATHVVLPAHEPTKGVPVPGELPATPQEAAKQALALLDPTTDVVVDGTASVAGRAAYELVLSPKDDRSLVSSVRLAVDAERSVPLRVQVLPRGGGKPAFEVGFRQVSFGTPGAEQFDFRPPPGATVTEQSATGPEMGHTSGHPGGRKGEGDRAAEPRVKIVGTGWTTVAILPTPGGLLGGGTSSSGNSGSSEANPLAAVLRSLPRVSGAWGSGSLLKGTVFSALLTDDGRLAIGAVRPELLYAALGQR
ncbi:MAG TPA: hypothetical protein VLJ59_06395 [Mycobacteriales bacterium]|nr:hypothetical protein [Mycobacteriales bacterium]